MAEFIARNSNDMAYQVYKYLDMNGVHEDSRNGKVLRIEEPCTMCYLRPWERGNFTPNRNANPFFHVAEAAWMLAGRSDVAFLKMFNSSIGQYSDNGVEFNAPYGFRAQYHFGHNQLLEALNILSGDPTSRQAVVQLWSHEDLAKHTKDKACNMLMVFSIVKGQVQLTVFNRSNDAVYGGVTGANPVHFSFIQQWFADSLGLPMGKLYFMSNNVHVYTDLYDHWEQMDWNQVLIKKAEYFQSPDLAEYYNLCKEIEQKDIARRTYGPLIEQVVKPMLNAWVTRKYLRKDPRYWLSHIHAEDLSLASELWMVRKGYEIT